MDTEQWHTSPRHEQPDQLVRWQQAASLDVVGLQLGLTDAGCWVVVGPSSVTELRDGTGPVFLFPLLQMSREEALSTLRAELIARNLDLGALERFPVENLILAALESGTEHWSSMALAWAEAIEPTPRVAQALTSLAESGATQAVRHRARKIARAAAGPLSAS